MRPVYEYGDEVRLIRNVRNDGTYPGREVGELLMKRGSVGCVYDVGTYLQDQLIYRVHFLDEGRTIGCRSEELIPASAPWINNRFEFRDSVVSRITLAVGGETVVSPGSSGEIEKVVRDNTQVSYHVRFHGRTFLVPESALAEMQETSVPAASAEQ
ncbi:nitrogen fixation protein NifZ [Thalassolituus oleivorans]|uniref:nitrogen fixation protein NifZ n=1 Tax=Thalassolituus oleivorans TaxID=187493 RepID=UPI0023EFCBA4|nr:nitrogen fixation protein NifZ [Thalassolituus oleivorans]|tara:strand:- start:26792 stop:27259 length:468 start_codon:yes stop_codon:yes gene_type:complete